MAFTHANALNKFGVARLIVATSAANGTHTTLAGAIADASSGDTIFLRDSVTENVTVTDGINITAWSGGTLNVPSITGTITMTAAGTCTISGLRLVTNSAAIIAVTGSAASILNVNNCYLSMGSDAITYSSSSSSSRLNLFNCLGDLTTTGIKVFAHSSAGIMGIVQCFLTNSGSSTTANTLSAGSLNLTNSLLSNPLTTSGSTASYASARTGINCNTLNVTALTHGCTNATPSASGSCTYASGSASAVSISVNALLNMSGDIIGSNNTNAITGAGTVSYSNITFFGTSSTINTTTQTTSGTIQGSKNTAPAAGFLGEELTGIVLAGSPVTMSHTVITNITSVTLTPGIWDITGMISISSTNTNTTNPGSVCSISTANNTNGGLSAQNQVSGTMPSTSGSVGTANGITFVIPAYRVVLAASTTYYLNCYTQATATFGATAFGSIKGKRVG